MSMLSVPDWSRKIAPAEWGIEETEQKNISEIFASGLDAKLEKINALRGMELAIVVILSVLVGIFLVNYLSKLFFTAPTQQTQVITRRAQKKVVTEVEQVIPAPWESLIDPVWMLDNCREKILSLVKISTPGWSNTGVLCTQSSVVTSWKRDFGRLSWIELALNYSDLTFTNKSVDANANIVTVSLPLTEPKQVKSIPEKTSVEMRNMLNDLFQSLNLSVNLIDGNVRVGDKVYMFINFKIDSMYDPQVWKDMLTKFSGLQVNTIMYNDGTWNYEGIIYVQ